ncbi:MAG: ATP-binding protein [Caulobacter sp.]|nr:ATP-binding protein [Caulobacter sp.]
MFTVLTCLREAHDTALVLIAGMICISSILTACSVYDRALRTANPFRPGWVVLAGLIAGCGVWATHFMGMLAYQPTLLIGYDFTGTGLSLAVSLLAMVLAFSLPISVKGYPGVVAAGLAAGLGIGAMHFMGMAAMRMPMQIVWNSPLVVTAVAAGASLSVLAFIVYFRRNTLVWRTAGGFLFIAAILALHFLAMSAVTLVPDAAAALPTHLLDRRELASITATLAAGLLLACLGLLWIESQSHRNALASLRASLDALPTGLAFIDSTGRLAVWNQVFADLLGVRGVTLVVGLKQALLLEACEASQDDPLAEQRWPDGRWIRTQVGSTEDGGGVIILTDTTAEKAHTEALSAARDEARSASRAKSAFLANMSHEIRTPLNGVMGAAELLAREPLIGHQAELVQMIHDSGDSLNRLLSDILDLARVETGKLEVVEEAFDLADTVRTATALFALRAEEKALGFTIRIAPEAAGRVTGDRIRLKQILGNLLSNAVKFTSQGQIDLAVDREPGPDGGLRFVVRDTGPGFDAATAARLFNRFEQADSSITRKYGGSGLGLAICLDLAQLLGGHLSCAGRPGEGATFTLVLPLPPAAGADLQPPRVAADAPDQDGRPMRVLVVDDHPNNRRFLEILLGHAGIETVCAGDGQAGVEAWRRGGFDAVLMDMQMPVMDGLAATRAIRELEAAKGPDATPVFMISANALPEHQAASRAAGADLHLAKPIVAAELFAALASVEPVRTSAAA